MVPLIFQNVAATMLPVQSFARYTAIGLLTKTLGAYFTPSTTNMRKNRNPI